MEGMRADIADIRQELRALRSELSALRGELATSFRWLTGLLFTAARDGRRLRRHLQPDRNGPCPAAEINPCHWRS